VTRVAAGMVAAATTVVVRVAVHLQAQARSRV